jgi:putative ABC transport system substrate-binding protein
VKRRDFITLLGGAAAASWSRVAAAQQDRLPLVGVLRPNPKNINETFAEPFARYMKTVGWEEGRNIRFLFVWAEGRSDRAPELARELVAQQVDLIIPFGDPAIRAVQRATQTIPIVGMTDDMVGSGLAASLARPGGNTTGVSILASELDVKRLEILHEYVPQARRIAALADPSTVSTRTRLASAARDLGVELVWFEAQSPDETSRALARGGESRGGQCISLAHSEQLSPPDHRSNARRAPAGDLPVARNRGGRGAARLWAAKSALLQTSR